MSDRTSARHLAQLIGKMSAAILAVYPALLHYRRLQSLKHKALANSGYDGQVILSEAKEDFRWRIHNLAKGTPIDCGCIRFHDTLGRWLRHYLPILMIQGEATGGCWNAEEQELHINKLELLAIFLALKSFLKETVIRAVLIKSDSITVVAHINKLGGTKSHRLVTLTKQIFRWCMQREIRHRAQHLRGKVNTIAD